MSADRPDNSSRISRRDAMKVAGAIAATTATAASTLGSSAAIAAGDEDPAKPAKATTQPPKMNGAQAFFKVMADGGVETVFGCPGTSEMQIIEELGRGLINEPSH